jgi:hypothetical protein
MKPVKVNHKSRLLRRAAWLVKTIRKAREHVAALEKERAGVAEAGR